MVVCESRRVKTVYVETRSAVFAWVGARLSTLPYAARRVLLHVHLVRSYAS